MFGEIAPMRIVTLSLGMASLMGGLCSVLVAQPRIEPKVCPVLLMTLGRSPISIEHKANVLEVRSCWPGVLQLVAWGKNRVEPLIVETSRTSIVSIATADDSVYVVETGGMSSNVIQAVVFEGGVPRLAFSDAFKAYAEIKISKIEVVVRIRVPGEPDKVLTFSTGIE
jgi:hypothetical protein